MTKETNTNQKAARQRALNRINLLSSILVFGTGLILFTQFHVVENPYPTEWHGLEKSIWLVIHQLSAIAFFIGLILHIQLHWKYLKTVIRRWSSNLPKKTRSKIRMQILFLLVTVVVLTTGFYPWIAMPGATIQMERYDLWIDIHNQAGSCIWSECRFILSGAGAGYSGLQRGRSTVLRDIRLKCSRRPEPFLKALHDGTFCKIERTDY
jgi:hypothetical protein